MRAFRSTVLLLLLSGPSAFANPRVDETRALAELEAGRPVPAAAAFWALVDNQATPVQVRQRAEFHLGRALLEAGFPFSAATTFSNILEAGNGHPFALQAVEGLVEVQARLDEQALIPSRLHARSDPEAWAALPPEVQGRLHLLLARVARRQGALEEARLLLESIEGQHPVHAEAQYLLAVTLADPRFPGDRKKAEARARDIFERLTALRDLSQASVENVRQLAILGLGRLHYASGDFAAATRAYASIPRESRYWDVALFEEAFARFRDGDPGGALGSLQALYAPQFASAFQPESRILTATVYYFSCLYDEAKRALEDQEKRYGPMHRVLGQLLSRGGAQTPIDAFRLLTTTPERLPAPVRVWVEGNARLSGTLENLAQLEQEEARIAQTPAFGTTGLATALREQLAGNREVLIQVAGTLIQDRLVEARDNIEAFRDQANIIRFEISNAEKELAMAGIDQQAYLASQEVYRPRLPAADFHYWQFQGEFWRDEIGSYRYTLKNGCALKRAER